MGGGSAGATAGASLVSAPHQQAHVDELEVSPPSPSDRYRCPPTATAAAPPPSRTQQCAARTSRHSRSRSRSPSGTGAGSGSRSSLPLLCVATTVRIHVQAAEGEGEREEREDSEEEAAEGEEQAQLAAPPLPLSPSAAAPRSPSATVAAAAGATAAAMSTVAKSAPSSPPSRCSLWRRYRALPRWKRALVASSAAMLAVVMALATVAIVQLMDLSAARFRWRIDAVRLNAPTGSAAKQSQPPLCQSAWTADLDLTLSNSADTDVRLADARVDASVRWQQRKYVDDSATSGRDQDRPLRQLACDQYWAEELAARLPEVFGPAAGSSADDANANVAARTFPLLSATHARPSNMLPLPSGRSATQLPLLLSFQSQLVQQTLRNARALSMLRRTRNATSLADLASQPPADEECLRWSPLSASVELKFRAVAHFSVLSIPLSRSVEMESAVSLDEWLLDDEGEGAARKRRASYVSASSGGLQLSFDSVDVRAFTDVLSAQVCASLAVELVTQERLMAGAAPDIRNMQPGDAAAAAAVEAAGKAHEEELFWLRHFARGGVSIGALPPLLTEIGLLPAHSAASLLSGVEPPTAVRLITNLTVTAEPLERWSIVANTGNDTRVDLQYSGGVILRVFGCVHAVVDEGTVTDGSQLLQALLDQTWRNESAADTSPPSKPAAQLAPLLDRVWLRAPLSASRLRAQLPCADRSAANVTSSRTMLGGTASPEASWRRAVWLWAHRSRMISDTVPMSARPPTSSRAAAGSSLFSFPVTTVDALPGDWGEVDVSEFIRRGGAFNGSDSAPRPALCSDQLAGDADGGDRSCFLNDLLQSRHLPSLDSGNSGNNSSSTSAEGGSDGSAGAGNGGDSGSEDTRPRLTDLSIGEPFSSPISPEGSWVTDPAPITFRTRDGEALVLHPRDEPSSSGNTNSSDSLASSSSASFSVRSVVDASQMWLRLGVKLSAAVPWLHAAVDVEDGSTRHRGALVLALRPQQVYSGVARYALDWLVFDRKPLRTSALLQRIMVGNGWDAARPMPYLSIQLLSVTNSSDPLQSDSSLLRALLSGLHMRLDLSTMLSRPLAEQLTDLLPVSDYKLRPPSPVASGWVSVAQPLTAPVACPSHAAAPASTNNSSPSFSADAVHSVDSSFSYTDWIQLPAMSLTMLVDVFAVDEGQRPQGADDLWRCSGDGDPFVSGCPASSANSSSSPSTAITPSDLLDLAAAPCQQQLATNASNRVWSPLPAGHAAGVHVGSWTLQVSTVRGLLNQKLRLRAQMRVRDGRRDTNQSCDSDKLVQWRRAPLDSFASVSDPAAATPATAQWDTCRYRSSSSNGTVGAVFSSAAEYVSQQFLRDGSGDACRPSSGATGCAVDPLWSSPVWLQLRLVPAAAWDWSRGDLALSATSAASSTEAGSTAVIWTSGFYFQPAADCSCGRGAGRLARRVRAHAFSGLRLDFSASS